MAQYTQYTTIQGDRWDLIAQKAYGDATMIQPLLEANPSVPLTPYLDGGIKLNVPVLDLVTVEQSLLPPWKR